MSTLMLRVTSRRYRTVSELNDVLIELGVGAGSELEELWADELDEDVSVAGAAGVGDEVFDAAAWVSEACCCGVALVCGAGVEVD